MEDKFARQQQAEQANAAAYCTAMNHAANILGGPQQTMSAEFTARTVGYSPGLASGKIGNARDKGEVEMQIDALDNQLKSLQCLATDLFDRFSPVLSGENASGQRGAKEQAPMYIQLGSRLFTMNMQATQLRESLQEIIDRCKL